MGGWIIINDNLELCLASMHDECMIDCSIHYALRHKVFELDIVPLHENII